MAGGRNVGSRPLPALGGGGRYLVAVVGWGGVGGEGLSRQWAGQDLVMVRGPGARRRQSLSVRWGGR